LKLIVKLIIIKINKVWIGKEKIKILLFKIIKKRDLKKDSISIKVYFIYLKLSKLRVKESI